MADRRRQSVGPAQRRGTPEERKKALETALAGIEKAFGAGTIMRLGEENIGEIEVISTGCIALDIALGVGGLPRGRVTEIYGPESSGKTTVALHCVAEAQKAGGTAAYIDVENALDISYARKLGVNVDELLLSQPDSGEQALNIVEALVRSGAVDILVVDSVAALVPQAEIDGDMGSSHVGLQARMMSQAMRKLSAAISKTKVVIIFINQLREKVGVMFGNPETTTGGRALKFYSTIRLDVRRSEQIKSSSEVIGSRTRVRVVKNKVAAPYRVAEFDIIYGEGISREGSLLDMAAEQNIIKKSGPWYSYEGTRIGQGRENARRYLKENPDVCAEVEAKVRDFFKVAGNDALAVDPDLDESDIDDDSDEDGLGDDE